MVGCGLEWPGSTVRGREWPRNTVGVPGVAMGVSRGTMVVLEAATGVSVE